MTRALGLVLALAAAPALAGPPPLAQPIDCALGESCFIQNYVDVDPGPGAADFACGGLSYDGHKGTDFALPSFAAMAAGVTVRAAAPGRVSAVRDGMADTGRDGTPAAELAGRDCGNGVVIDHGDGWETQYCHLRAGSVAVRRGERVAAGAALGLVGYSGNTQFPHLHLSLRRDGAVVDPFDSTADPACGGAAPLWAEPLGYVPGGLIAVGLAPELPDYEAVKSGAAAHPGLPAGAPALVGWAYAFGGRAGDVIEISIAAPGGVEVFRHEAALDKAQAQLFRAAGRRAPPGGWAAGGWTVSARLIRDGAPLATRSATVEITR